jgi:purine-nucleoside/S-methyl-5'-thioadenosine phosphorylase / adenosine deaminase
MPASPEVSAEPLPPRLQVASWSGVDGLAHGYFGRDGGVSGGELGTLNVSERVGDEATSVAANWSRVRRALPGLSVVRMQQVHGTRVVPVATAEQPVGEADGMLTTQPGIGLAVLTADCVPMLAFAPGRAVMAVHAGWRGSLAGTGPAALQLAERELGIAPSEWRVALGPSIGGCCYEVEADIGRQFVERWGAMPDAWQPAGDHGHLDLRRANRAILVASGVNADAIVDVGPCTSCANERFFSHRRSQGRAGRQLSVIGLSGPGCPAGR